MRAARSPLIGDGHPSFAGGDRFVGIERIAGDLGRSLTTALPGVGASGLPGGRQRMSGVFDHPQAVTIGERLHLADVDHHPGDVNGDDSHRPQRLPPSGGQAAAGQPVEFPLGIDQIDVQRSPGRNRPELARPPGSGRSRPWRRTSSWERGPHRRAPGATLRRPGARRRYTN